MILFIIFILMLIVGILMIKYKDDSGGFILANISFVMLICLIGAVVWIRVNIPIEKSKNEINYESLLYKIEREDCLTDDLHLYRKEVIDEIQEWDNYFIEYQFYSENWLVSIFYPKEVIENVDLIALDELLI